MRTVFALTITAVEVLIVAVFFKGFILPREQCDKVSSNGHHEDEVVTPTLLVIIDALRYDMTTGASNPDTIETLRGHTTKLMSESPTTTSQRLKAIGTGGIPAFMEIGRAFDSDTITEDNILRQAKRFNLSTAFIGDDTWLSLYPSDLWTTHHAFPSFNVHDLDTVDTNIINRLSLVIQNGSLIHDFTVLHFLGIDHAGHRYGKNHPEMRRKLQETNTRIRNITDQLSKSRNMILIFGDHGMTDDGDHGGGTSLEVTSAISVVKNPGNRYMPPSPSIEQVDLTPTLSFLLNLPIPFVNVGRLNKDIFALLKDDLDTDAINTQYLQALSVNMRQVFSSLLTQKVPVAKYKNEVTILEERVNAIVTKLQTDSSIITIRSVRSEITTVEEGIQEIMDQLATAARNEWSEMDQKLMYAAVFVNCCLVAFLLKNEQNQQHDPRQRTRLVVLAPALIHAAMLLSNSFIVREEVVVSFLFRSMLLLLLVKVPSPRSVKQRIFISLIIVTASQWLVPGRSVRVFGTHNMQQPESVSVHDLTDMVDMLSVVVVPCFGYLYLTRDIKLRNSVGIVFLIITTSIAKVLIDNKRINDNLFLLLATISFMMGGKVKFLYTFIMLSGLRTTAVWLGFLFVMEVVEGIPCRKDVKSVLMYLLSWCVFYHTGHQTTLSSIDVSSAFVGFSILHHTLQGVVLVGINTFSPFFLPGRRSLSWVVCFLIQQTGSLLSTTIHRRHLMVWEIFAPRMLFAVVIAALCTSQVVVLPQYLN